MPLQIGTKLGPYEILAPLGAGGMGEVYKAKDTRLDRLVAIKVLPEHLAKNPDSLARFEREAKAVAALNHPNITGLFDIGREGTTAYAVMELLEGESLRSRLMQGPLSPRLATELAVQMAHGLAAAHDKGVVHRDLKPENLWVTSDGRLKILDFGLAKQVAAFSSGAGSLVPTESIPSPGVHTEQGAILGTMGYMSPEQVRGESVDARSDIFSFGVVLFEMLTGKRAFARPTAADTMAAVLKEDPPDLDETSRPIPPGLRRVLDHCLEKIPSRRFHDAHDLAFALESASAPSLDSGIRPPRDGSHKFRHGWVAPTLGAVALAAIIGAWWLGQKATAPQPTFQRLTFGKGTVEGARFSPSGNDIFYSARWQGAPPEIYSINPGNLQPRDLGIQNASLLSISSSQELAVMPGPRLWNQVQLGPLARVVPGGSGMREVLGEVQEADWMPDGARFAVMKAGTVATLGRTIEFPAGHVIHHADLFASHLRVAPARDCVALYETIATTLANGQISVLDTNGKVLAAIPVNDFSGLAWGPGGKEIWYSEASDRGSRIWASDMAGHKRLLLAQAGWLGLLDVDAKGRVLADLSQTITGVMGLFPPDYREKDLSWNEATRATDFTPDRRSMLIGAPGRWSGGIGRTFYLRSVDGAPPIRLGEASAFRLFPDGHHVLAVTDPDHLRFAVVPVGPGESREVAVGGLTFVDGPWVLPDGRQAIFGAMETGKPDSQGYFLVDLQTGTKRSIGSSGMGNWLGTDILSPDGKAILAGTTSGDTLNMKIQIVPLDGGSYKSVPGLEPGDITLAWTPDQKGILVFNRDGLPARIHRIDLATGKRDLVREILPANPAGLSGIREIVLSKDGRSLAYNYSRKLSDLYLIEGLK